ncbi:MAG: hypothetical protein ACLRZ7_05885 [Lachnospiraceae bacterium]
MEYTLPERTKEEKALENLGVDCIAFLEETKKALKALEEAKQLQSRLSIEDKRLEKLLAAEERSVSEEIVSIVKTRKEAIMSSYDKEISIGQDKLRKLRAKKERAKSIGISERIKEETEELDSEKSVLTTKLTTLYKQNGVPSICNSRLFYSLFMPRTFVEFVIAMLVVVALFFLMPYGIYYFIPVKKDIILTSICFGVTLVFGGIYLYLTVRLKQKYLTVLLQGVAIRGLIRSNRKKVRVIVATIKKDQDDANYNLDSYNYDIAKLEAELEEVATRKQDALSTFEAVTTRVIRDEITESYRARIDEIKTLASNNKTQLKEAENDVKNLSIYIADHYEGYLGKDFLQKERIDTLLQILQKEEVGSLTEAITFYRNSKI